MNSCVLKHLRVFFLSEVSNKKFAQKTWKHFLRRATNVTISKFRGWRPKKNKTALWDSMNELIHEFGPKILRSCLQRASTRASERASKREKD